jgi:hypothetical protein
MPPFTRTHRVTGISTLICMPANGASANCQSRGSRPLAVRAVAPLHEEDKRADVAAVAHLRAKTFSLAVHLRYWSGGAAGSASARLARFRGPTRRPKQRFRGPKQRLTSLWQALGILRTSSPLDGLGFGLVRCAGAGSPHLSRLDAGLMKGSPLSRGIPGAFAGVQRGLQRL